MLERDITWNKLGHFPAGKDRKVPQHIKYDDEVCFLSCLNLNQSSYNCLLTLTIIITLEGI